MDIPTYEGMMSGMLATIPDSIDKREGSLIYTALAPVCSELVKMYIALQGYYDLSFGDTAEGEYLDRIVNQYGIYRRQAVKAVWKAMAFDRQGEAILLPEQGRFMVSGNYCTVDEKGNLVCEEAGEKGNYLSGEAVPAEYLSNFGEAYVTELLTRGEDEEKDSSLRQRFYQQMAAPAFGGNVSDYRQKAKAIDGVGAVKVIPAFAGGGTVKLILLGENFLPVTGEFAQTVQQQFDPEPGKGLGLAPIGHTVTAVSAEALTVNLSASVTLQPGADTEACIASIKEQLEGYFSSIRQEWEDSDGQILRVSRAESAILSAEGVIDVQDCVFNGVSGNLALTSGQVPLLGDFYAV